MNRFSKNTNQETFNHAEKQLKIVLDQTPESIKAAIKSYIADQHQLLTNFFYIDMLEDQQTAKFLDHEMVNKRLKTSLGIWLKQLFSLKSERDLKALIARQLEVGGVHARIQVPIHLVAQGSRFLKRTILKNVREVNRDFDDY
jgi:diguanylate cyclase